MGTGMGTGATRLRRAADANRTRYTGGERGHYESFFCRANHPERPLAFWLRYTIFSPRGRPAAALGELWGMFFDGEAQQIEALRKAIPFSECHFADRGLDVRIAGAHLDDASLSGELTGNAGEQLAWKLSYAGGGDPLYLLPHRMYEGSFPKAKALVGVPGCRFDGELTVGSGDGRPPRTLAVEGWRGSQNHNWGSKHTDAYAWVQCAGFDGAPDAFLECAIARLKVGPLWTPALTVMTLRVDGQEHRFDDLLGGALADGAYAFGPEREQLTFQAERRRDGVRVRVRCEAPRRSFVALTYLNPPGGERICLNTKIARCEVTLERPGHPPLVLRSRHGAAFEILADDPCGLPLAV